MNSPINRNFLHMATRVDQESNFHEEILEIIPRSAVESSHPLSPSSFALSLKPLGPFCVISSLLELKTTTTKIYYMSAISEEDWMTSSISTDVNAGRSMKLEM